MFAIEFVESIEHAVCRFGRGDEMMIIPVSYRKKGLIVINPRLRAELRKLGLPEIDDTGIGIKGDFLRSDGLSWQFIPTNPVCQKWCWVAVDYPLDSHVRPLTVDLLIDRIVWASNGHDPIVFVDSFGKESEFLQALYQRGRRGSLPLSLAPEPPYFAYKEKGTR